MKWAKSIRYQTVVQINGKVHNLTCLQDFDEGYSLYSNGEYIADVDELPTKEEAINLISEYTVLEGARV